MIEQTPSRPLRIVSSQAAIPPPVSLPPRDTTRWVASRKALVVAAVERGQITIEEAMAIIDHSVSPVSRPVGYFVNCTHPVFLLKACAPGTLDRLIGIQANG